MATNTNTVWSCSTHGKNAKKQMNASNASFESNKVVFVPNMVVTIVDLLM